MDEQQLRENATKQVEARLGFFIHLVVYVCVNAFLIYLCLSSEPQQRWFMWPLAGWGAGVVFHALTVFVFANGPSFKERLVEKEMERERQREKQEHAAN